MNDIGPVDDECLLRLKKAGINSLEKLLLMGGSRNGRAQLAVKTGLSIEQILEWVNRADLSRVRGLGSRYTGLLESSGVGSVRDLSRREADTLYQTMYAVNQGKHLVQAIPPVLAVADWIKQAKKLPRAVNL